MEGAQGPQRAEAPRRAGKEPNGEMATRWRVMMTTMVMVFWEKGASTW